MTQGRLHAEFIASGSRRVLVTARLADHSSGSVLVAPAFAEEMNKSRRMVTELAAALAKRGVSTIVVDLFGTGDSEGEFAEASLDQWLADLEAATAWAAAKGVPVQAVLGVRFGCLLLSRLAQRGSVRAQKAVLWQPVIDGARMIDQFLRLRVAAQMIGEGAKESVAGLRAQVQHQSSEVAGYELTAPLVAAIDGLRLDTPCVQPSGRVSWIEVMRSADAPVGVASKRAADALRAAGVEIDVQTTTGDPFWTSTEIVTSEALVEASVAALCDAA